MNKVRYPVMVSIVMSLISGSVKGEMSVLDKANLPCNDKPNCVSTQDPRQDFSIAPFILQNSHTSLSQIEPLVLSLPRTKLISQTADSMHFTCKSRFFGFIDDLIVTKDGDQLQVRSESRIGYSDFGVNRKRTEMLRQKLIDAKLIQPST